MNDLFGEQTRLTVENMSFSGAVLDDFGDYLRALAAVKLACARANHQTGELDAAKYEAIARACEQLMTDPPARQFPVDVFHGGGGIGINMNINEVLASLAGDGVDAVEDVNMSQSTSDVCHTALRVALIQMVGRLAATLGELEASLRVKASEFEPHLTIARTCLQDGMRVSAGVLFAATASTIARLAGRLQGLTDELAEVNLGGTVIGSGVGASPEYRAIVVDELAELTGLKLRLHPDLYAAAAYPEDLLRLSSELDTGARACQKFAQDLRLLSSGPETGFGELKLPNVQAGSSFFPGKVNPVLPEMMIQCALLVGANHSAVSAAYSMGEVHLNVYEPLMGFLVMRSIELLDRAIATFNTRCMAGIELDVERSAQHARAAIPSLVDAKERYGYRHVSELVARVGLTAAIEQLNNQEPTNQEDPKEEQDLS